MQKRLATLALVMACVGPYAPALASDDADVLTPEASSETQTATPEPSKPNDDPLPLDSAAQQQAADNSLVRQDLTTSSNDSDAITDTGAPIEESPPNPPPRGRRVIFSLSSPPPLSAEMYQKLGGRRGATVGFLAAAPVTTAGLAILWGSIWYGDSAGSVVGLSLAGGAAIAGPLLGYKVGHRLNTRRALSLGEEQNASSAPGTHAMVSPMTPKRWLRRGGALGITTALLVSYPFTIIAIEETSSFASETSQPAATLRLAGAVAIPLGAAAGGRYLGRHLADRRLNPKQYTKAELHLRTWARAGMLTGLLVGWPIGASAFRAGSDASTEENATKVIGYGGAVAVPLGGAIGGYHGGRYVGRLRLDKRGEAGLSLAVVPLIHAPKDQPRTLGLMVSGQF